MVTRALPISSRSSDFESSKSEQLECPPRSLGTARLSIEKRRPQAAEGRDCQPTGDTLLLLVHALLPGQLLPPSMMHGRDPHLWRAHLPSRALVAAAAPRAGGRAAERAGREGRPKIAFLGLFGVVPVQS